MTPQRTTAARAWRDIHGWSDAAIAARLGITRQRVHQLLGPRVKRKPAPLTAPSPVVDFAAALREWRERRGLSQSQAAALLRIGTHTVSCWETGRNGCSLAASMLRLMELLP